MSLRGDERLLQMGDGYGCTVVRVHNCYGTVHLEEAKVSKQG